MGKRVVLGLTEKVTIIGHNGKEVKVTARIDTGATASSIDSKLAGKLELGPILKSKVVKSAYGSRTRPIVKAKVKLNSDIIEAEFSLVDRSHLTYSVLLGQNILRQGDFLIDPNKKMEGDS
ncbi:MAG: RimK/LysX family protein [Candidatus Woesearchaeota archaeon]